MESRMHARTGRRGFTLVEVMVSLVMMLIVFGAAVPFFNNQIKTLAAHSGRFDAQQNATLGANMVDQELRAAGLNVAANQPTIVQAATDAITFNGDLVSRTTGDVFAIYNDTDVAPGAAGVWTVDKALTLPNSAITYPLKTYQDGPVNSRAETISYYLTADTYSNKTDERMLMRRVNDGAARLVARGIKLTTGKPFFRYFTAAPTGGYTEITTGLPLVHTIADHAAASDTGSVASARTDAIRLVRLEFTGIFRGSKGDSTERTVRRTVKIWNAGMQRRSVCGGNPSAPANAYIPANNPSIDEGVDVDWTPSSDQTGGTKDVERYLLFRRLRDTIPAVFGEPIALIPADNNVYTYNDKNVIVNNRYVYGVAAQDCGLEISPITVTNSVRVDP
jgi:prepilin-type N-terminal cleavage/methylation domain-containing protein